MAGSRADVPNILELAAEHVPATLLRQQRLARLVGDEVGELEVEAGEARFGSALTAPAQLIGATDEVAETFTWAWAAAEGAFPEAVLTAVNGLRDYGQLVGADELTEAVWSTLDVDPFLLAAIARGWTQADALYRFPYFDGAMYALLGDVPLPAVQAHEFVQALTTGIAMAPMDHRQATVALCRDAGLSTTGLDEIVVATIDSSAVTVAFTRDGRIDGVDVARIG